MDFKFHGGCLIDLRFIYLPPTLARTGAIKKRVTKSPAKKAAGSKKITKKAGPKKTTTKKVVKKTGAKKTTTKPRKTVKKTTKRSAKK